MDEEKKRKKEQLKENVLWEWKCLYSSIKLNLCTMLVPLSLLVEELLAWPLVPLLLVQNKHLNDQKSGFPLSRVLSERQL